VTDLTGWKIPVTCACGATFTVDGRFAGRQGNCPKCRRPIMVPAAPQVICPACRTPNSVEELFCTSCGGDLSAPPPAAPPTPAAPRRSTASAATEVRGVAFSPRPHPAAPAPAPPAAAPIDRRPTDVPHAPAQPPTSIPRLDPPPRAAAAAPAKKGGTEVIVRGGGKLSPAAPPAPPPAPAHEAAAPAAEGAEAGPKRLGAMRHKLEDMKKTGRSVFVRIPVFLVLAGGAGYGAWYFAPRYFQPHIDKHAQEEKDAAFGVWPEGTLEDAYEKIKKMSLEENPARKENPALPFTPEERAVRKAVEETFEAMKKTQQEASRTAAAAHEKKQYWQLGMYGAIGLAALLFGMIGWRLSR
jgi:hypothetical protein